MEKVKLTQLKSAISKSQKQKDTLKALGLDKIGDSAVKEISPQIEGMIKKVSHLIRVENLS